MSNSHIEVFPPDEKVLRSHSRSLTELVEHYRQSKHNLTHYTWYPENSEQYKFHLSVTTYFVILKFK